MLSSNLADIAAKLAALASPKGDTAETARGAPFTTEAYTAARNELAGLVKLIDRALSIARQCEQPRLVGLLTEALAEGTAARNDVIARWRKIHAADHPQPRQ
jgi:hypothetical protein